MKTSVIKVDVCAPVTGGMLIARIKVECKGMLKKASLNVLWLNLAVATWGSVILTRFPAGALLSLCFTGRQRSGEGQLIVSDSKGKYSEHWGYMLCSLLINYRNCVNNVDYYLWVKHMKTRWFVQSSSRRRLKWNVCSRFWDTVLNCSESANQAVFFLN